MDIDSHSALLFVQIITIICFVASILATGIEVAFLSVHPQITDKDEKKKRKFTETQPIASIAAAWTAKWTTRIIGIILIATVYSQTSQSLAILYLLIIIVISLLLGDFLAIISASRHPEFWRSNVIPWLVKVFSGSLSEKIYKLSMAHKKHKNVIKDHSTYSTSENETSSQEGFILEGIVKFSHIDVKDILRPRIDVVSVDFGNTLPQVLQTVVDSGYSRIPVYAGNFDNVKGILYVKDLLPYLNAKDSFRWQALIRPPYFVPDTKKVKELLTEFQTNKIHMAVIVDEYGGTLGIVTLEDVLEEIVGEISDESDEDEKFYSKINDNTYIFDGKTLLNDFHKIVQADSSVFEDVRGEADTLAGLILELKGAIPTKNEQITHKNFTFKIISADSRRIKQIKVEIAN